MRAYSIQITDPKTGKPVVRSDGSPYTYTSIVNGVPNFEALQVEIDLSISTSATPRGASFVRIYGISIEDVAKARSLVGKDIQVFGGMKKGLPLAKPSQYGLLVSGQVQNAFSNWVGTNTTLDILIVYGYTNPDPTFSGTNALPIVMKWPGGTPLRTVIFQTILTAFPGYTIDPSANINANLVLANDEDGYYGSVDEFASYIKELTRHTLGALGAYAANKTAADYRGVDIYLKGKVFYIFDGTKPTFSGNSKSELGTQDNPVPIDFLDLIGQPVWQGGGTDPVIQFEVVMRYDLDINTFITMPKTAVTTTPQSYSQYRESSILQGTFGISFIRHIGNFREPRGEAWVTVVSAYATIAENSSTSGSTTSMSASSH